MASTPPAIAPLRTARARLHQRYLDACRDYAAAVAQQWSDQAHLRDVMRALGDQLTALDGQIAGLEAHERRGEERP